MADQFVAEVNDVSAWIHLNNLKKGFWPERGRNLGEVVALIHSEVTELLETLRVPECPSPNIPEFSHSEEEAADILIRVMDLAESQGWELGEAVLAKVKFNERRPHKHGKAF